MYTQFIQQLEKKGLPLSVREKLKKERGFTESTLSQARLCSGSWEHVSSVIEKLKQEYPETALLQAGLINEKGNPRATWVEKDGVEGIIIPYLEPTGEKVLYLRCHKMGPKGVSLEVYGQQILELPLFLKQQKRLLVITEGEFKALALIQCGIPSLAIPGISSFVGLHFPKLEQLLLQHKVEEVILLFDNEIKDDPSFTTYQPHPLKRYDTDFYAIAMAKKLYQPQKGIQSALIARLPDSWREQAGGKIDPDGALALGKTPLQLQQVILKAVHPDTYLSSLSEEAQKVISYRLEKEALRFSPLKEKKGRYVLEKKEKDEVKTTILSNFVMTPKTKIRRASGKLERGFEITNTTRETVSVEFKAEDYASLAKFQTRLFDSGDYFWDGQQVHFNLLQKRLHALSSPLMVKETSSYGRQEDGSWIFKNGMLSKKQTFFTDTNGIIWGPSLEGILPLKEKKAPFLMTKELSQAPSLTELYDSLSQAYCSPGISSLFLGWNIACVFSHLFYEEWGFFPILLLQGEQKSGKTSLARMGMESWGFENPKSKNIQQDTIKSILRNLAKFSSMPVFLDEFRNDLSRQRIALIRACYDRQGYERAEFSNDNRTQISPIHGCLLLAGEEKPLDPALHSRCITFPMDPLQRNKKAYEHSKKLFRTKGRAFMQWLEAHENELWPKVIQNTFKISQSLHQIANTSTTGERIVETYSIALGSFTAIVRHLEGESPKAEQIFEEVGRWIEHDFPNQLLERHQENHLERFFNDLTVLALEKDFNGKPILNETFVRLTFSRDTGEKQLFLHFPALFKFYQKSERTTGKETFSRATIKGYLEAQPYTKKPETQRMGKEKELKVKVHAINLNHQTIPGSLKEFVETLAQIQNQEGAEFEKWSVCQQKKLKA